MENWPLGQAARLEDGEAVSRGGCEESDCTVGILMFNLKLTNLYPFKPLLSSLSNTVVHEPNFVDFKLAHLMKFYSINKN